VQLTSNPTIDSVYGLVGMLQEKIASFPDVDFQTELSAVSGILEQDGYITAAQVATLTTFLMSSGSSKSARQASTPELPADVKAVCDALFAEFKAAWEKSQEATIAYLNKLNDASLNLGGETVAHLTSNPTIEGFYGLVDTLDQKIESFPDVAAELSDLFGILEKDGYITADQVATLTAFLKPSSKAVRQASTPDLPANVKAVCDALFAEFQTAYNKSQEATIAYLNKLNDASINVGGGAFVQLTSNPTIDGFYALVDTVYNQIACFPDVPIAQELSDVLTILKTDGYITADQAATVTAYLTSGTC